MTRPSARSRSRPSGPTTTTPTSGGRITSSSATRSSSIWRGATSPSTRWPGAPSRRGEPGVVDPYGGRDDLATGTLRAVGDPLDRFEEDALRMVRAVRLAATLELRRSSPRRCAAIADPGRARASPVGRADRRRAASGCWPRRGRRSGCACSPTAACSAHLSPDLAAQRGVPQNKVPGEDLWDHTLRAVDGARRRARPHPARRSAPRHRQAGDHGRRPLPRSRGGRARSWPRAARATALADGRARPGRAPRPPAHVRLRCRPGRTRRSGGSSPRSVSTSSTTCSCCGEADNVGSGHATATPASSTSSWPGSRPQLEAGGSSWTSSGLADRRRRPDGRARLAAGTGVGTTARRACSSGSSPIRR